MSTFLLGLFVGLVFLQTLPLGLGSVPAGLVELGLGPGALGRTFTVYPAATRVSLTLFLAAIVPAFAAVLLLRRRGDLHIVAGALTAAGGILGLYAFLNYLSQNSVSLHFQAGEFGGRANGTFVNPNHFAAWIGLVLPVALSVLFLRSKSWKKPGETSLARTATSLASDVSRRYWKVLTALAVLVMFLALVFSASRMGIIAAVAGVILFAVMAFFLRTKEKKGRWWPAVVVLIALAGLTTAAWVGLEPVLERFSKIEPGMEQRVEIWESSMALFRDFPILGSGLGTFPHAFPAYQPETLPGGFSFPHNEYIHILCETGIAGFLLIAGAFLLWMAGFLISFVRSEVRSDRIYLASGAFAGVFTLLLNGGTELAMRIPANLVLLSLLVGTAVAAISSGTRRMRRRTVDTGSFHEA
jgi:O-antigen ligase